MKKRNFRRMLILVQIRLSKKKDFSCKKLPWNIKKRALFPTFIVNEYFRHIRCCLIPFFAWSSTYRRQHCVVACACSWVRGAAKCFSVDSCICTTQAALAGSADSITNWTPCQVASVPLPDSIILPHSR